MSPLLSWVYIKAPFIGSLSFSLLDLMGVGGKVVTAVVMAIFIAGGISAILAAVVRDHPVGRIFPASAGLTAAGYAAFLLIYGPSALHSANTYSKMAKYVSAHVGPGLWMFAGGGILMVIGAFLPRRRRT
ncbi:hypothetical protein [Lentzea nigeriaca]|uniref:hypothetical protein n=1 Tax=Lentzea nigeriaca TaxID=1128665 RepID=UPI001959B951|nr:hypothetical protein [Lentzea nigeriaca]MBM7858419.1 hypothetical protein [Lentzea nigeriaca]